MGDGSDEMAVVVAILVLVPTIVVLSACVRALKVLAMLPGYMQRQEKRLEKLTGMMVQA